MQLFMVTNGTQIVYLSELQKLAEERLEQMKGTDGTWAVFVIPDAEELKPDDTVTLLSLNGDLSWTFDTNDILEKIEKVKEEREDKEGVE